MVDNLSRGTAGSAPVGSCALAVQADVLPQGRGTLDAQLMNLMHPELLEEAQQSFDHGQLLPGLLLLPPRRSRAICSPHRVFAALRCLHCKCSRPHFSISEPMLQMHTTGLRYCPPLVGHAACVPVGDKRWKGKDGRSQGGGGGGQGAPVCLRRSRVGVPAVVCC